MYFDARISVTIGNKILQTVSSVKATNDGQHIGANCEIMVPLNCRIQYNDGTHDYLTDIPRNLFKSGDPVEVKAKYEGMDWVEIFKGYVNDFNEGTPITIKCVDSIYLLNQGTLDLHYDKITLFDLLKRILEGTGISIVLPVFELTLVDITFRLMSPAAILEWIKKQLGLQISLTGTSLYVNLASNTTGFAKFDTTRNVFGSDLQKPSAVYVKLKVKAWFIRENGTRDSFEVGDPSGQLREVFFYKIPVDQKLYQKMAEEALVKYKQYKYSGTIDVYLYPKTDLFWKAEYKDYRYPEKNGNYVITGIETSLDESGYHNKLKLSFLSDII